MNPTPRWQAEREYFDEQDYHLEPILPGTIDRYTQLRKPWLPAEYSYFILGDVRGKRILEIGCGDGAVSVILALRGARVTGIDISQKAIDAGKRRAELHHVSDLIEFVCGPLELFDPPDNLKFDIIIGSAILHHLIPVLNEILAKIASYCTPQTQVVFTEPIALSSTLRRLRLGLPIEVEGTPDERPLELPELELIRRHFPKLRIRYFDALLRFMNRFYLRGKRYEELPKGAVLLYDSLARLDNLILNSLNLRKLASSAIMVGSIR